MLDRVARRARLGCRGWRRVDCQNLRDLSMGTTTAGRTSELHRYRSRQRFRLRAQNRRDRTMLGYRRSILAMAPRGFSSTPLPGTFTKIAIVNDRVCGLTTASEVQCSAQRGQSIADLFTPEEFAAISANSTYDYRCELRPSGQVECWEGEPAAGQFVALTGGWNYFCGLRLSGEVECWVTDSRSQSPSPPQGEFIAITAGTEHTCGLRPSGEVECWGPDYWGRSSPPAGEFTAITAGSLHTCGLRPSGEVECWGYSYEGQSSPPGGPFTKIAATGGHTCGLRPSGGIECWGEGINYQAWG